MANIFGSTFGSMLQGVSKGLTDYQTGQEDLSYLRQERTSQLAGQQLAQQAQQLQNTQAQNDLQEKQDMQQYFKDAAKDTSDASSAQTPAQSGSALVKAAVGGGGVSPAAANGAATPNAAGGVIQKTALVGPLKADQYTQMEQSRGLPAGLLYGFMKAESGGNPDAVSSKGAQGLFGTMPATAANPGYGVKPYSPKDPEGVANYVQALYKKTGGNVDATIAAYNAGLGGDPRNPETAAYIPKVKQYMGQFIAATAASKAAQTPSPADHVEAAQSAGVDLKPPQINSAVQGQQNLIKQYMGAAQKAQQAGNMEAAQSFTSQAMKLQEGLTGLQEKQAKIQTDANKETANLAHGVTDQSSYNNMLEQMRDNPAMQASVRGLNLTGDYETDKNKLATVADRALTIKDQQDMKYKQQEIDLKRQTEQREQAKADQGKVQQEWVQKQDQQRAAELKPKGIPFSPSIAASAPPGTSPQAIATAQNNVDKANAAFDKANAPVFEHARNASGMAAALFNAVDDGSGLPLGATGTGGKKTRDPEVSTGGAYAKYAGDTPYLLTGNQQKFNKDANALVLEIQQAVSANGGARSAMTNAMFKNIQTTKPNITLDPAANKVVARQMYVAAQSQVEMNNFLDEYRQSNPGASLQSGVMKWHSYEQALGPTMVYNKDRNESIPNMAGVPKLEDGSDNPAYKDWHAYFANGDKF